MILNSVFGCAVVFCLISVSQQAGVTFTKDEIDDFVNAAAGPKPIQRSCGPGMFKLYCNLDLNLTVSRSNNNGSIEHGSTDLIWVDVEVVNIGDDSYRTEVDITYPSGVLYVNFDSLNTREDMQINCSLPIPPRSSALICNIGNPLPAHSKVYLRVYFQPIWDDREKVKTSFTTLMFSFKVTSSKSLRFLLDWAIFLITPIPRWKRSFWKEPKVYYVSIIVGAILCGVCFVIWVRRKCFQRRLGLDI